MSTTTNHNYHKCTSLDAKERGLLLHNCYLDQPTLDLFDLSVDKIIIISIDEIIYCINICDSCASAIQAIGFDLGIILSDRFTHYGSDGAWIKIIDPDRLNLYKIL